MEWLILPFRSLRLRGSGKTGETMQIVGDRYWHVDSLAARRSGNARREILETIALTVLIFIAVRGALPTFWVQGESMLPSLHSEERVVVNKAQYFRYDANFFAKATNPEVPADMHYLFGGPQR